MSYTTIYIFGPDGTVTDTVDFQNAYGSAIAIWGAIGRKYLTREQRDPHGLEKAIGKHYDNPMDYADQVWKLGERLENFERLVLDSTFDNAVVRFEDLQAVAEAFEEFARIHGPWFETNKRVFSVGKQGEALRALLDRDDVRAVAWRQTSVSSVAWDGRWDEEADEEIPYNLDAMDTHWFIPMPEDKAA